MFLAHAIRLRDPWQCEPTEDGGLRWTRLFHRPTGLEPDDQLHLVITGLPPNAQVTINGHALSIKENDPAPSPVAGMGATEHGRPEVARAQGGSPSRSDREGGELGTGSQPRLLQFNLTPILADSNAIELVIPPQASSLKPQASFPYDARLAIVAAS